jgi:hypothetical protein
MAIVESARQSGIFYQDEAQSYNQIPTGMKNLLHK